MITNRTIICIASDWDYDPTSKHQVMRILARQNQVDTWAMTYRDILVRLFDTDDPKPVRTVEELEEELEYLDDAEVGKKQKILENIERLKGSELYKNQLAQYEERLKEREKELDVLMTKLKEKLRKLND